MGDIVIAEYISECPCKGCKKRKENCHSKCKEYLKWSKENQEHHEKERNKKVNSSAGWGYIPRKKKKL